MGFRYYIKSWPRAQIGKYPGFFVPFYRTFGKHKQLLVGPETDIVIEGYPRSANTFSVVAFEYAQSSPVNIAHHLHVPSQILYAVRRGIPVIVLLRDPEEAVASLVTRHPYAPITAVLREYIGFYRAILPVADKVVVGEFNRVTDNFGSVISRVNEKYGTRFAEYHSTEDDKNAVFDRIKAIHKEKKESPHQIAIPSINKSGAKNAVKTALGEKPAADLLEMARGYYESFLSMS